VATLWASEFQSLVPGRSGGAYSALFASDAEKVLVIDLVAIAPQEYKQL
jgi:hypothetical protein